MDFILELLAEIFIGGPIEAFFESKNVKDWVKNLIFTIFWLALELFLVYASYNVIRDRETWPICLFCLGGTLLWTRVGFEIWKELRKG